MSRKKSKRLKKIRQRNILTTVLVLIVIMIGIVCIVFAVRNDTKASKGYHEITSQEELENLEIRVKSSEGYVEPDKGTLDMDKIQGFTAAGENVLSSTDTTEDDTDSKSDSKDSEQDSSAVSDITLADSNLTVEAVGSYSGNFLEDGSDEPTANVAAMLITNNSDKMLQIAEISFKVNEKDTAVFKVTDLPAGTSTLALESNKREFSEEDAYTYGETATAYIEQPSLEEDKFELETEDGKITLKNKTDKSYEKVYVYYKYVQIGGAYLGGITYRTPFENVPAGGEAEAVAAHFNPESSKIMAVQIQQEQ